MRRTAVLFGVLVSLLGVGVAFGQLQKGAITVYVLDGEGAPLAGATVEAGADDTLSRRSMATDADGVASFRVMEPSRNYDLAITLEGFWGARVEAVRVRAGATTPVAVTLLLQEVVCEAFVEPPSSLVDVHSAQTGLDISLDWMEALPTSRSVQDFLQFVPGVQAAISDADDASNPASRSGINYADFGGEVGVSTTIRFATT